MGFYDDFSDVGSGWPRKVYYRNEDPKGPVFDVNYENGSYRAKIILNTDARNNRRMGIVPAPWDNPYENYEIEVDHRFAEAGDQVVDPTAGKGALIFGANDDFTVIYVVEWNFEGQCAVSRYWDITLPTTIINLGKVHHYKGWGSCPAKSGFNQHNDIRVVVEGDRATIYVNGDQIESFSDSNLRGSNKVGFLTGSWDRTPVEGRFDDFRVKPR
jgi:hypothetical protein